MITSLLKSAISNKSDTDLTVGYQEAQQLPENPGTAAFKSSLASNDPCDRSIIAVMHVRHPTHRIKIPRAQL